MTLAGACFTTPSYGAPERGGPRGVLEGALSDYAFGGDLAEVTLALGARDGVAVGDQVRVGCEDFVGQVVSVERSSARVRIAKSGRRRINEYKRARVTLGGAPAAPWCREAQVPPGVLEAKVLTPIESGNQVSIVIKGGTDAGVAVGDAVRIPCEREVGRVIEAYPLRSRFVISMATFAKDRANRNVRVTLKGRASAYYCP